MARPLKLEEFDIVSRERGLEIEEEPVSEKEKLEAFEQGYQAGWDDATASQHQDQSRITADLESSLKDLSFTFHEARAHVLNGVEPLLCEIVEKVLPTFSQDGLASIIAERLKIAFSELSERPVVISVSPSSVQALEAALPSDPGFPITLKEEKTLGEGQAFLNLGSSEEYLDLDEAIRSVKVAIQDFFEVNKKVKVNG